MAEPIDLRPELAAVCMWLRPTFRPSPPEELRRVAAAPQSEQAKPK